MKTRSYIINNIVIALLLIVGFAFSAKSQVTIGAQSPPLKGAILDLKQMNENSGGYNSTSGMMLTRVYLDRINNLTPILKDTDPEYDILKARYSGLIVYNVNTTSPLEKGFFVWNGDRWNKASDSFLESISANNGLLSGKDTVVLGGNLNKQTLINLDNNNLIFNHSVGKIGVETDNPQAVLHIGNSKSIDPLILQNVNFVSDVNTFDDPNPVYYNLRISENGVIRKSMPVASGHHNLSFVYNVIGRTAPTPPEKGRFTEIDPGDASGNNGTVLTWTKDGVSYEELTLPESGTYAFSFRLYGRIVNGTQNTSKSFYLSALKNNQVYYTTELVVSYFNYRAATFTVNLTVTGAANDKVKFKIGDSSNTGLKWRLVEGPVTQANRTSMFFWRL